MLSMKGIAVAAVAGIAALGAGLIGGEMRRSYEAEQNQMAEDSYQAMKAREAAEAGPELHCDAGGWIRSMQRVGADYQVELADGSRGTFTTDQVKHICGEG